VLLGYGLCGNGVAGLTARSIPLVIPRAHDCITFFFGSREAYRQYFEKHPGTYYMTSGWSERNAFGQGDYSRPAYGQQGVMGKLGLADSYEEMVAKYGKENADFISGTLGDWLKNYSKYLYLRMGICEEADFIEATRRDAAARGWDFELREGNLSLLRRLFSGEWNQDFVVVRPGHQLVARHDELVLDSAP